MVAEVFHDLIPFRFKPVSLDDGSLQIVGGADWILTFDFYYFINIKFCVADRLDFFNNLNTAFSTYADASAGRNDIFHAWIARIFDRC